MQQREIKAPVSRKRIAELYNINQYTLVFWLKSLGIRKYTYLNSDELILLFDKYGYPLNDIANNPKEQQCPTTAVLLASATSKAATVLCFPVRRKLLARIFQIDRRTVSRWISEIGVTHSKTLSPKEVKAFFAHYGTPSGYRLNF